MSIKASFYSSIHQGWLAREVYILPLYLSPENCPDSFFFHCCLPKLVSGRILRGRVLESCICWYSLLACAGRNRELKKENNKTWKKPTKDGSCSQNSSIGFLSCLSSIHGFSGEAGEQIVSWDDAKGLLRSELVTPAFKEHWWCSWLLPSPTVSSGAHSSFSPVRIRALWENIQTGKSYHAHGKKYTVDCNSIQPSPRLFTLFL